MFGSLLGGSGPKFKPMKRDHLVEALAIIEETDEDDAAEAEESLLERGTDGMFVLMEKGRVVGITGAVQADGSDDTVWLSWTYLTERLHGQGWGRFMVDELLKALNEHGIRKMFIATSDYREDGEDVYAPARKFYEALGAEEELRIPGYHSKDETKIIYGLVNPGVEAEAIDMGEPSPGVRFDSIEAAPESENGFGISWSEAGTGVEGLDAATVLANQQGARLIITALPDDLSALAATAFTTQGYEKAGSLADFYAVGSAQDWWVYRNN